MVITAKIFPCSIIILTITISIFGNDENDHNHYNHNDWSSSSLLPPKAFRACLQNDRMRANSIVVSVVVVIVLDGAKSRLHQQTKALATRCLAISNNWSL